jgi:G3E family GTPase
VEYVQDPYNLFSGEGGHASWCDILTILLNVMNGCVCCTIQMRYVLFGS